MVSLTRFISVWMIASVAFLAFSAWLHANGFLSEAAVRLWGKAILQVDGPRAFKSSEALYPPLPFVITMMVHSLIGSQGIPPTTLIGCAAAGCLAALWLVNLVIRGGYALPVAALCVFLLAANPLFLIAVAEGPEMTLLCMGTWVFTRGIVHLRLSGTAPDMMKVAVGLMIVGLSSTYGLLIALVSVPFLAIAARPSMLVASPVGYLMAMSFPVAGTVGALMFLSSIFNTPLFDRTPSIDPRATLALTAGAFGVAAMPALISAIRLIRSPTYAMPVFCATCTLGGAMALDLHQHLLDDPLLAASPLIMVSAVGLRFWPASADRAALAVGVLSLSWLMSAGLVAVGDHPRTQRWAAAVQGDRLETFDAAYDLVTFLDGKQDILIDAEHSPDLVIARGTVDGLVLAGTAAYELTLFSGNPAQSYIVVRHGSGPGAARDSLRRRFPDLATVPPRGYLPAYADDIWIVLARQAETPPPAARTKG